MCIGHDVSCSGSPREHCFSGRTANFAGKGPQNFRACGGLEGALRARGNLKTPPYTITPVTLQVVVGVPGSRIFQYISQQEHQRHGTAYQGVGADPIALGHDADLNLDAAISPAELLIALLTQLVRKAHLDETTLAYVARL